MSSFKHKDYKDDLLFVPLGGCNEIGMNLNLYQYKGKWIMIDLGIGFADDYLPGIEVVLPNIDFLQEIRQDIIALVLTHAHEDHMGAVPYLWDEINLPIYATPFTAAMLKYKMSDEGLAGKVRITEVKQGSTIDLGPFSLELIDLTHSIPEMQAIAIKTDRGTIIHTGDWKLDPTPMLGPVSDEKALEKYGDEGVLALVCDSTNVFVEGESGSEEGVRKQLKETIGNLKRGVVVTTFASNIARVESIVRAGHEAGRRIALVGRSLHRVAAAAKDSGYLTDIEFLSDKEASKLPPEEVMILCTGCQGESRAALSKLVQGQHPYLRLHKGDTVIFSSKIIPGNETRIRWLHNRMAALEVEVITEKNLPIHVSGHPARAELQRMYQLCRPQIAVPVHGEAAHIKEHAAFAKSMQVPEVVECENGVFVCLSSDTHPVGVQGYVPSGYLAVDGTSIIPIDSPIIKTRRKLKDLGCVMVSLTLDKNGKCISPPLVSGPGVLDPQADRELLRELSALAEEVAEASGGKKKKGDGVREAVLSAIRKAVNQEVGKKPVMEVHIHRI